MIDEEVWIVKKIGVEQSLTNIQAALREKGYEVVSLQTESDAQNVDCCVVTGLDAFRIRQRALLSFLSENQHWSITEPLR